jgi:hypothetical protein
MLAAITEFIEQGELITQSDRKRHQYVIRSLDKNDLAAIMQLQTNVLSRIAKKEYCVPILAEEILFMLEGNGDAVGLFMQDKLYAACFLLFNVPYEINMARELSFSDEELTLVSQLELSLVDFAVRGHRLQCKLAGILVQRAQQRKNSRYVFATVSPYNYPSIQTVTALGLQIAKLGKMYYGWDRYIVYKDFIHPIRLDTANPISVPNTAYDEQIQLLNEGYRGFSQFKDQDGIKIMYAKMIS